MWQNNVSWKEGLFAEIPFKRFQAIKTKTEWDSPLALFTRLNPAGGNDWPNLRLEGIQLSTSPRIGAIDTLFSPDYYIVAVDTRSRTTECTVSAKTQDGITGSARVTIEYQVDSLELLLRTDDPIARLKDRTNEIIQEYISERSYFSITESDLKRELQAESQNETGISIKRFFSVQINWPESIAKKIEKKVVDQIDSQAQDNLNKLKIQKLNEFGIYDRILIASVLSQNDTDFDVIMGHIRSASEVYQNQVERDRNLLDWLANHNYLTRVDVQKIVDSLTERINDQSSFSSSFSKALLASPDSSSQRALESGASTPSGKEQDGLKIGKRKLNLSKSDDKENEHRDNLEEQ